MAFVSVPLLATNLQSHKIQWHCQFNLMRPNGNCSPSLLCTHRFLPHLKGLGAQKTIIDRLHEVAAKAKEVLCEAMECQEFLGLPWGFEPSHRPFSLPRRFVRDFGSIVRIDVVDVRHRGHDRTMSGIIASEFVSHQPPGFSPLAFEKTAEKSVQPHADCDGVAREYQCNHHLDRRHATDTGAALEW